MREGWSGSMMLPYRIFGWPHPEMIHSGDNHLLINRRNTTRNAITIIGRFINMYIKYKLYNARIRIIIISAVS